MSCWVLARPASVADHAHERIAMLRVHTGNPRVLTAHRLLRIDRFAQFAQASLEVMWVHDFNKSSFVYQPIVSRSVLVPVAQLSRGARALGRELDSPHIVPPTRQMS
jgi:hypothetical protein